MIEQEKKRQRIYDLLNAETKPNISHDGSELLHLPQAYIHTHIYIQGVPKNVYTLKIIVNVMFNQNFIILNV